MMGAVDRAMNEHVPHPGPCCDRWQRKVASAAPDTPSTEALTPDDRLRAMLWEAAVVGSSQGVLPASLRRRFDEALTERAVRQEAADTSAAYDDLMRYFGEVSMGGPLHHGTEQWDRLSREVRRIVASLARQEAADPSGLREAAQAVIRSHRKGYWSAGEFDALEAALRGATERPLDVNERNTYPACRIDPRCYWKDGHDGPCASPTTETPDLPLNSTNGPWCGCGQRWGHRVSNSDCTAEPAIP